MEQSLPQDYSSEWREVYLEYADHSGLHYAPEQPPFPFVYVRYGLTLPILCHLEPGRLLDRVAHEIKFKDEIGCCECLAGMVWERQLVN